MNWIHLAQDRKNLRADSCEHRFVTLAFIECSEVFALAKQTVSFFKEELCAYRFDSRGFISQLWRLTGWKERKQTVITMNRELHVTNCYTGRSPGILTLLRAVILH